jgi:hypothetical protein
MMIRSALMIRSAFLAVTAFATTCGLLAYVDAAASGVG